MRDSLLPLREPLQVETERVAADRIMAVLGSYLTPARRAAIAQVVTARTFAVVPVLEHLTDAGNVAAVLRSAEGLGYGAAHVVEPPGSAARAAAANRLTPTRVTQGADKWLFIRPWPDSAACVAHLRAAGLRVVATSLSAGSVPLAELDLSTPVAIAFGNEHRGVSPALAAAADQLIAIPMCGFTRSFNVSVAAALVLAHVRARLPAEMAGWQLTAAERRLLTADYYVRSQPHAAALLRQAHSG